MTKVVSVLFGTMAGSLLGGKDKAGKAQAAALAAQRADVEADRGRVASIEAGQRRLRAGGGGGLRAFLEDEMKSSFGG